MTANTLQDSKSVNSPELEKSAPNSAKRLSSSSLMGKAEFEQIAKKLKLKLSRASVTAKQQSAAFPATLQRLWPPDSPVSQTLLPKSSPLKSYYMLKRKSSPNGLSTLDSLPYLKSPTGRSPELPGSSITFSISPFKGGLESNDSPTQINKNRAGAAGRPETQMFLKALPLSSAGSPPMKLALNPLPVLDEKPLGIFPGYQGAPGLALKQSLTTASANRRSLSIGSSKSATTPVLAKKQLSTQVFATPTQPGRSESDKNEEADLLMYLATSPSPAMPYRSTPKAAAALAPGHQSVVSSSNKPNGPGNQFLPPQPPISPKKPLTPSDRTPQRFPLSLNGMLGSTLPSECVSLTPADFNLNDYINFFTPSPAIAASIHHGMQGKSLMQTPNIPALALSHSSQPPSVDAKMINFDGSELFSKLEYVDEATRLV